jgi:hypothetical protein
MAKTKNEARTAWAEAEADYRKVIDPYLRTQDTEPLDKAALLAISKARGRAERCLDAYIRRIEGTSG